MGQPRGETVESRKSISGFRTKGGDKWERRSRACVAAADRRVAGFDPKPTAQKSMTAAEGGTGEGEDGDAEAFSGRMIAHFKGRKTMDIVSKDHELIYIKYI